MQLHVQDRVGLDLGQLELPHEPFPRHIGGLGAADQGDHCVQVVQRDLKALKHMSPLLSLAELEGCPADDDLAPVLDEGL